MKLRELIDKLDVLSRYGQNDTLEVHAIGNDEMLDMDVVDARIVSESNSTNYEGCDYIELKLR